MSITQHLQNKSHRENEIKKKSLVKQRATYSIEESVGKMLTKNTVDSYSYRRIDCKALLIACISFSVSIIRKLIDSKSCRNRFCVRRSAALASLSLVQAPRWSINSDNSLPRQDVRNWLIPMKELSPSLYL